MENKELMNVKLMEILKEALYEYRKNMENKELMNVKLMEILKEALYEYRKNLEYFEAFKEAEDAEIKQIYWSRSEEHDGKCEGLLTAYEILTGRAVLSHLIKEEIKHLNKKF